MVDPHFTIDRLKHEIDINYSDVNENVEQRFSISKVIYRITETVSNFNQLRERERDSNIAGGVRYETISISNNGHKLPKERWRN